MLQAHYRSILDLSNDALVASEKGFQKIIQSIDILEKFNNNSEKTNFDIQKWKVSCYEAMNDDFNTPILIANIFDAVKFINKANIGKAELSKEDSITLLKLINSFVIDIMRLQTPERGNIKNDKTEEVVSILLQLRNEARRNKDYALGDKIRDMLKEKGISINDKDNESSFSID
jgi:cysteinyl-tRNA synthetase